MKQVYSDIIQYRGNHYDFGYMQGEEIKNSLLLSNRQKQKDGRWRHYLINQDEVTQAIKKFAPGVMDELYGLGDALQLTMEETIREFGGYYLEYGRSGCSIFTSNDYLIRNYDNAPITYEGRYALYQPTDQGYAVIGPTMQITGRTDGMNEKGLTMGYNFVNRMKSSNGFVCNMIGRIILETCASVDEAIDLLKEIPHRHTFSYVLQDKSGKSMIVEASPRIVTAYAGNICTNHFEQLTEENRYRMDESIERQAVMKQQQHTVVNPYTAYQMMNDIDKQVFSKKYGAWAGTIHTAAYFPKEMKAWFALGGDRLPLIFDFNKWLNGENLNVTRIKGGLHSSTAFANVEVV
ncbi:acyl-CoA--6-aminopenicillanic acid acyltransferase [Oceanobacillus arenosus]|uniref:Acyl-CoA--6-aminopenicillanic acid acyltransferase n=1 Tax=Oceanobacillus arenosus TaxID=1229153 RepID=A0A3D8PS09_9BACI|nr:C45 family peptidase [Oceanobacillus arenosus]RDW18071.1 acyl-CoA--6-aminopenicillanic acid acyltransferase [Oceanobacillus arenosus]